MSEFDKTIKQLSDQVYQDHLDCIEYGRKIAAGEIEAPKIIGLSAWLPTPKTRWVSNQTSVYGKGGWTKATHPARMVLEQYWESFFGVNRGSK